MGLKEFLMNNIDIILTIIGVIMSFFVIKYVTKILFKLIFSFIIIGVVIIITQTISDTNMIDYLNDRYCNQQNTDLSKCECVVNLIMLDINTRFSVDEIETLKNKKLLSNTELIKSYITKKNDIDECLENYEKEYSFTDELLQIFIKKNENSFIE
ncbi:MAG: hypothetical protein CMP49_03130 [Flavobacteriales bacterium]|nr:hypothetical protein [Flavobacteriales bacterium]|tara:strand:+ start:352 stop:816 length:465 start_codon:yes stop_codon:yes gene_type:complete